MNIKRLRPRSASTVVAAVLLVLFASVLFLYGGFGLTSSSSFYAPREVSAETYRALDVGRSRESIEEELGEGPDAIEFRDTGLATEPMDAECLYWLAQGAGYVPDVVQLCFRDDELVRKRLFPAGIGAG